MIENYGLYALKVLFERDMNWEGWVYEIHNPNFLELGAIMESADWYDSAGKARLAAIEKISDLEDER